MAKRRGRDPSSPQSAVARSEPILSVAYKCPMPLKIQEMRTIFRLNSLLIFEGSKSHLLQ